MHEPVGYELPGDLPVKAAVKLPVIVTGRFQVADRYGGEPMDIAADTVVFVSHNASNRELLDTLADYSGSVIDVGDALSPRYLQTAIREGHMAARSL
jgi:hypothetical protein